MPALRDLEALERRKPEVERTMLRDIRSKAAGSSSSVMGNLILGVRVIEDHF